MSRLQFAVCVLSFCAACAGPTSADAGTAPAAVARESVKPGINKDYLDPALDAEKFVQRFETESREVFVERAAILAAAGPQAGQRVADIGAGTGLFTLMFADAVGPRGKVYGVDIAPAFVDRLAKLAAERGLSNIEGVVCGEDDVRLPPGSIDLAFVCDTYHHFEYPSASLASIHRALRAGGELVVVDFQRIEGVSREWTLQHVRAGLEVVVREIEDAGFERVEQAAPAGLRENYMLRFRRR